MSQSSAANSQAVVQGSTYALVILTAINLLNYLDRYILAGALSHVKAEFSLNDTQAGLLATVFIMVYTVVSPLGGYLGDTKNRIRLIALAVVIWSVATIGSGLAVTFGMLIVARALTGVGEAGYGTVGPSVISDFFPPQKRTRILSFFYLAMPIGAALGFVLGGTVAQHSSWRHAFYVGGIPGLVMAVFLLKIKDPPRGRFEEPSVRVPFAQSLKLLKANSAYTVCTVGLTLMTFSIGGLSYWMPTFLKVERGMSESKAGMVMGATTVLGGLIGTLLGGMLGPRLDAKRPGGGVLLSGIGLFLAAPLMLFAGIVRDPTLLFVFLLVAQIALFLNLGPLNAAILNAVSPAMRSFAIGLCTMIIHLLGDALSPTLIGFISDETSLETAILCNALPVALAGIVLIWGANRFFRPQASS